MHCCFFFHDCSLFENFDNWKHSTACFVVCLVFYDSVLVDLIASSFCTACRCIAVTTTLSEDTLTEAGPSLIRKEIGKISLDDIINGGSSWHSMQLWNYNIIPFCIISNVVCEVTLHVILGNQDISCNECYMYLKVCFIVLIYCLPCTFIFSVVQTLAFLRKAGLNLVVVNWPFYLVDTG